MTTIPHPCLEVQLSKQPEPAVPCWFAETVILTSYLRQQGLLDTLNRQVHLVRARFGQYEVLDFWPPSSATRSAGNGPCKRTLIG